MISHVLILFNSKDMQTKAFSFGGFFSLSNSAFNESILELIYSTNVTVLAVQHAPMLYMKIRPRCICSYAISALESVYMKPIMT